MARLARATITTKLLPKSGMPDDILGNLLSDQDLKEKQGTFVTLKIKGQLRGCMGNLTSSDTIVEGIKRNAITAALHDPRFAPLSPEELVATDIEISVLSMPQSLAYEDGHDLVAKLRPGVDGVIIKKGLAGATFLPQVWEQLPRPEDFLAHLCHKAGLPMNAWQDGELEVSIYQAQYFHEEK